MAKTKLRTVNGRPLSIDKSCKMVYNKLTDASSGTVLLEESRYFDDLGNELSYCPLVL